MIHSGRTKAFSLIEIAFSLGIIATVVIAILGILPAGIDAAKRAADSTVVATIFGSLHHRLVGEPLTPKNGNDTLSFSPALFDAQGRPIASDAPAEELGRAVYQAELKLADWSERPANTSSLRVVTITLTWPVSSGAGASKGQRGQRASVSYPVTTLTGTDWPEIARAYPANPTFMPKIGF